MTRQPDVLVTTSQPYGLYVGNGCLDDLHVVLGDVLGVRAPGGEDGAGDGGDADGGVAQGFSVRAPGGAAQAVSESAPGGMLAVVVSPSVMAHHEERLGEALDKVEAHLGMRVHVTTVPDGEEAKHAGTLTTLWQWLGEIGLRRTDAILAIGGGVIGDMVGFAAATYNRGVALVHVPTTLLAMVDSAIGGKTGINTEYGKNLVGAFWQPRAVIMDMAFIQTLPLRERIAGFGEIAKYACIGDPALGDLLVANAPQLIAPWTGMPDLGPDDRLVPGAKPAGQPSQGANPAGQPAQITNAAGQPSQSAKPATPIEPPLAILETIILRCAQAKATIVSEDETEQGRRALLNYGHTFGHAIEQVTHYALVKHGEAVGLGMLVAANMAWQQGRCDIRQSTRDLLEALGLPTELDLGEAANDLYAAMTRDKKATSAGIRLILPVTWGNVEVVSAPDAQAINDAYRIMFSSDSPIQE